MAKDKENYGPEYLYSEDLLRDRKFVTVTVKVEEVIPAGTLRTAAKKLIDRPTLKFVGKQKMLVLNKTNEALLKFITGHGDLSQAVGFDVTVAARMVKFGSDYVVGLRIMPPDGTLVRKSVKDRLGTPAVWEGPAMEAPKPKEPEPTMFEQLTAKLDAKETLTAEEHTTIFKFISEQHSKGNLSDDEFAELGGKLNEKVPVSAPAE